MRFFRLSGWQFHCPKVHLPFALCRFDCPCGHQAAASAPNAIIALQKLGRHGYGEFRAVPAWQMRKWRNGRSGTASSGSRCHGSIGHGKNERKIDKRED